jgi:hypothetical protein
MESLRKWNAVYYQKTFDSLSGEHSNELFSECVFDQVNNLTLKNCVLAGSEVVTDRIEDALGLTVTLDCNTFNKVKLSELMFDMMLILLFKTSGNTEKRLKLLDVVGKDRAKQLLDAFKTIE